jgi:hypothetical protein
MSGVSGENVGGTEAAAEPVKDVFTAFSGRNTRYQ